MKKVISVVLALALMCTLGVCAFAASNSIAPSVNTKGIPSIVAQSVGSKVYEIELCKDGEKSYYCNTTTNDPDAEIIITPFSTHTDTNKYFDEVYFMEAYRQVVSYGVDLTKINENLDSSYVVRDFFDITIKPDTEAYDLFYKDGYSLKVTFAMNTTGVGPIYVMNKCKGNDVWKQVGLKTYTDSITLTFDELCPVMILVRTAEQSAPGTGVQSTAIFGALAAIFAIASVVVVVYKKKKVVAE